MADLISNVLDFARGRLGEAITLNRQTSDIAPVISQVIDGLQTATPDRRIDATLNLRSFANCDRARIAQLLSNLLGNALTHGDVCQPKRVSVAPGGGIFELWVANAGHPILPAAMKRPFQPFFRGEARPAQAGLGLFIARKSPAHMAERSTPRRDAHQAPHSTDQGLTPHAPIISAPTSRPISTLTQDRLTPRKTLTTASAM